MLTFGPDDGRAARIGRLEDKAARQLAAVRGAMTWAERVGRKWLTDPGSAGFWGQRRAEAEKEVEARVAAVYATILRLRRLKAFAISAEVRLELDRAKADTIETLRAETMSGVFGLN